MRSNGRDEDRLVRALTGGTGLSYKRPDMRDAFRFLTRFGRKVVEALFPLECLACGRPGTYACPACIAAFRLSTWRLESRDAGPLLEVRAAAAYADPLIRRLISDWKYEGWSVASDPLERIVRRWASKHASWREGAVIVPVPLHPSRLRERGFNQAERIAGWLTGAGAATMRADLLRRVRRTRPQAKLEQGRDGNVRGAFSASLPDGLRDRPFLLVDDVWTSGATMRACAAALLAAGASEVRGFVIAQGNGRQDR